MIKNRRIKKSGLNSLQAENAAVLGDYDKIRKPNQKKSSSAYINYFVVFATIIFVIVHSFDDGLEADFSILSRALRINQTNDRLSHHPIIFHLDNSFNKVERIDGLYHLKSRRISTWTKQDEAMQKRLWNDGLYEDPDGEWLLLPEYHDMDECKPMHSWATKSFPTCNSIHETSLHHSMVDNEHSRYLAHGAFRAVYKILAVGDEPVVLKTFHGHKVLTKEFEDVLKDVEYLYTPFFYDKHRMDALIYERMSPSPRTIDIYGYCGFAGFFEFADGEVLEDIVLQDPESDHKRTLTRKQKLSLAIEVAEAVTDLHTIEGKNGFAAFMHGDLSLSQFVRVGGRFKLNDFNRGHIFYWNEEKQSTCPYPWDEGHRGYQRAPEEYAVQPLTEKVDVYTVGNLIYSIVFGIESYSDFGLESKDIYKLIKKGILPKFSHNFKNSDHAIDKALYKAMMMCNRYKPENRAKASEVRDYLRKKYRKYYGNDREIDKAM